MAHLTLVDAPAVLGWQAWREVSARYALGTVRAALRAAITAGAVPDGPVDPLAQILLASVEEAALVVARAEDQEAARATVGAAVGRLVEGLRASVALGARTSG